MPMCCMLLQCLVSVPSRGLGAVRCVLLRGAFADACTVLILVCRHTHAVPEPHWLYDGSVCNVKHLSLSLERACSMPWFVVFLVISRYFHALSVQLDVMRFPRQKAGVDVVFLVLICGWTAGGKSRGWYEHMLCKM